VSEWNEFLSFPDDRQVISETLETHSILTQLISQEDYTAVYIKFLDTVWKCYCKIIYIYIYIYIYGNHPRFLLWRCMCII
jgi:hypothetical protein